MAITERQRKFAETYLTNGGNGSQAYRTAYDARNMSPAMVATEASNLLKHPNVALIIGNARLEADGRTEIVINRYAITKERILEHLAKIAFSDARDIMAWTNGEVQLIPSDEITEDAAFSIAEIAQTQNGLRIKMADKKAALVDLGKHLGMWAIKPETDDEESATVIIRGGLPDA